MNYDSILLELLTRIQTLEEKVASLEATSAGNAANTERGAAEGAAVTTANIRDYIHVLLDTAADEGKTTLILRAGDIHRAMKLVQRMPQVCNAMRQCMREGDRVLFETPSGYSSTLEIQYFIRNPEAYD